MADEENVLAQNEYIIENDPDSPLLSKFVEVFLRNETIASVSEDKRQVFYRG